MTQDNNNMMLDRVQRLVEMERSLTEAMERAEPWLPSGNARPLPSSMEDVENVLNVARNLASRTSAPSGWNPAAPLLGFSTPNPLPHQLRGGSLGALQLEMARKHQQEVKQEQLEKKREREEAKKKEESQSQNQNQNQNKRQTTVSRPISANRAQQQRRQPVIVADMNLSDSSSSEEEESDED